MKALIVNQLLLFNTVSAHPKEEKVERVLWVDPANIHIVTIDIVSPISLPIWRKIDDLIVLIGSDDVQFLANDPYQRIVTEEELSDKAKTIRDKAWEIVSTIASQEEEPFIYNANYRAEQMIKASQWFGIGKKTILKYLRRYWQRGKTKNALLPDFDRIAVSNKGRSSIGNKRGRPRKYEGIVGQGINVTEDMQRTFRVALNRFYYNNHGNSLLRTYELMRREYFSDWHEQEGKPQRILRTQAEIPTFGQFKYFYYKERNWKKEISSRQGKKQYLQNHRTLIGSATADVAGPGVFQIDATVADVYLVSRYNRNWIIGRPIVYGIVDTFSRMVVAIYVGLEGPSWLGAMMALANVVRNKVELYKEYGIEIKEEEFPVHHLPVTLIADQGEMASKLAEPLIQHLNIRVLNTSPYRPEMKAIIERFFKTINEYVKPMLPGGIKPDFRERGACDYRLDAKLDIHQFTQIMLKAILHHNHHQWLKEYIRDPLMIQDEVESIPIQLWNWGIQNRAGKLRTMPEEFVKLSLLPSVEATVTARGIRFKVMLYSSETALRERWFERARNQGAWKVKVSYDPRNLNYLYLWKKEENSFDKCFLLEHHARYKDKTMEEIDYLIQREKLYQTASEENRSQEKVDLLAEIEETIHHAETMTKKEQTSQSNRKKIQGIRVHRQIEKMNHREMEAFELNPSKPRTDGEVISMEKHSIDIESQNEFDLLRRKQRENRRGNHE